MAIIYESATAVISGFNAFAAVVTLLLFSYSLYALYLHPLRSYPGPRLSAITRIPYWIACLKGDQVRYMTKLHRIYGPVVRFGPNDLSYTDGQAWKDINSVQKGKKENGKEIKYHRPPSNGTPSVIVQNDPTAHAATRRVFSPAFSEKALKAQEHLFQKYADLTVRKGLEVGTIDMAELFNFATFDVMAELAFGESLGLLERGAYSSWVATIFDSVKILPLMQLIEFYPALKWIYDIIEPKWIVALRSNHFNHTADRVNKRLKEGSDKPDLWNLVVESNVLTLDEMHINAELFMAAGTETTASLLSGMIYYLLAHPDKMKLLTEELRNRFDSNEDITFEALAGLEYLNACVREGLRIYPPVPSSIPREIAEGGNVVMGKWLPAGTRVSVHQTATYRSPANFRNPDKFAPERWLGDPEYKDDNREAHQPFSTGPRNCLGMNMAWHEVRLLLSKVLYNLDIESDVGPDWLDQKVYVIWSRKPLVCKLTPAVQK